MAAAAAASAAANSAFNIELWTLYALGVLVTALRTYARFKAVSVKDMHADDILVWVAIVCIRSRILLQYGVLVIDSCVAILQRPNSLRL